MYILLSNSSLEDRNFIIGGWGDARVRRSIGSKERRARSKQKRSFFESESNSREISLSARRASVYYGVGTMGVWTNVFTRTQRARLYRDPVGIKI